MEFKDVYITPFFLIFFYAFAIWIRGKFFKDTALYKYILPGFYAKVIGALAAGLIYYQYYGTGDTIFYFLRTCSLTDIFFSDTGRGLQYIFGDPFASGTHTWFLKKVLRAQDTSAYMVVRWATIFSILSGKTYSVIALWFATISFAGSCAMLKTFYEIYPKLSKQLAICILFIPSVIFWGSGLFKDTLSFAFVGFLTWGSYAMFIKRANRGWAGFAIVFSLYFLFVIKTYIVLSFLPSVILWVFFTYRSKIQNQFAKTLALPFVLILSAGIGVALVVSLGSQSDKWSVGQVQKRAQDMQWWHTAVVEIYGEEGGGSYYSLGDEDFSIPGIIRKIPIAINVTLFRPYIWEVSSVVMLMAAVESLFFLLFSLRILLKTGPIKLYSLATANPVITFALIFSLIFAFGVGFTSYNFGALVRYKIPCMPFFLVTLYLLKYHTENKIETESNTMNADEIANEMDEYYRTDTRRLSQSW